MKPLASIILAAALVSAVPTVRPSNKTQVAAWLAYYAIAAPKKPSPVPVPPKPEKPTKLKVELNAFGLPVGTQPNQTLVPK